ncbi:hypothetical protein Poly41_32830 [Novipirellula artificiosorum]|uniref:Uncharacterized protein n=1 Tax=Novipirellula artificiosorum TaxID=2528016 RepID=A0A5C6DQ63_9BACT|nr:hypothetical protein Poly41_32830 [Novipirellula artificiosorum]
MTLSSYSLIDTMLVPSRFCYWSVTFLFVCRLISAGEPQAIDTSAVNPLGDHAVIAIDRSLLRMRIESLDSPNYATRQAAFRWLLQNEDVTGIEAGLVAALQHSSLEVRCQCNRLLDEFAQRRIDGQVERLLDPQLPATEIKLPLWESFARNVGDDTECRVFYATLFRRYRQRILQITGRNDPHLNLDQHFLTSQPRKGSWETTLPVDDSWEWSFYLLADTDSKTFTDRRRTLRVMMTLAHSSIGPKMGTASDQRIFGRLVEAWLRSHASVGTPNDRLRVAMRFGCNLLASELANRILSDPRLPATWQTTAMLAAARLSMEPLASGTQPAWVLPSLDATLRARLADHRVANASHLMPGQENSRRTQVRDVAMAALLQLHSIDPRSAGFSGLRAHPTMLFLDHSLGFHDDESRKLAHHESMRLLAQRGVARLSTPRLPLRAELQRLSLKPQLFNAAATDRTLLGQLAFDSP